MPLHVAPIALSAATVAVVAILNARDKARGKIPEPIPAPIPRPVGPLPPPIRPPPIPTPTPIQPEPVPGPIPKIPGTDRPFGDNVVVIDAPNGLRVHSSPSVTAPVVALARNGTTVTVFDMDVQGAAPPPADSQHSEEFGWARIRIGPTQQDGFVAARFLSSSGAAGLEEKRRQEKERQGSEAEAPIFTLGHWPYHAPAHLYRYASRGLYVPPHLGRWHGRRRRWHAQGRAFP